MGRWHWLCGVDNLGCWREAAKLTSKKENALTIRIDLLRMPSVEVVGGGRTAPEAIRQAMAFYAVADKQPILLHKEFSGHVGNRLQAALYREVCNLISQGVLSVADADAVSRGAGPRWGVMGPSLQWHVGGGAGG